MSVIPIAVSIGATVVAGLWGLYRWHESGGRDWMVNIALTTEVLPYSERARLLVVHTHSKNPLQVEREFTKPQASFLVSLRPMPRDLQAPTRVELDAAKPIAVHDLLPGDGYIFMPGAEFDDASAFVVPVGSTFVVEAELTDGDSSVSAEKVVLAAP
jgi:hypothetical protein